MARRSAHLALFALALSGAGLGQARVERHAGTRDATTDDEYVEVTPKSLRDGG